MGEGEPRPHYRDMEDGMGEKAIAAGRIEWEANDSNTFVQDPRRSLLLILNE